MMPSKQSTRYEVATAVGQPERKTATIVAIGGGPRSPRCRPPPPLRVAEPRSKHLEEGEDEQPWSKAVEEGGEELPLLHAGGMPYSRSVEHRLARLSAVTGWAGAASTSSPLSLRNATSSSKQNSVGSSSSRRRQALKQELGMHSCA
ncbi:hypothetical protein ABZP36_034970 [Zizania latifolia]